MAIGRALVIDVAIVEDLREMREGLAILIDSTEGYRCKHTFSSMEEALESIPHEPPAVVLVDIGLPGMSGIEGTRILKQRCPDLAVLMLPKLCAHATLRARNAARECRPMLLNGC